MAKFIIRNGNTSNILRVFLLDSTSTTGAGKTGLTFSSTGLIIGTIANTEASATTYTAAGSTVETVTTLGTYSAPTATKVRFREVDATNFPGVYEIQIADARFAVTNASQLLISVQVTGVAPMMAEVQLTGAGESWIASGVWNAQVASYASAGSGETLGTDTYGTKLCRTTTANRNVAVAGTQRIEANTATITAGAITNAAFATSAISSTTFAANALDAVWATTTRTITGTSAGAVVAASFADDALVIASAAGTGNKIRFAADAITSTVIATDAITNAELAATAVQEIWDYNISAYSTAGLAGTYLKNAGGAGNPWLTDISSAVTYPTASTAGGYMRSAYTETTGLLNSLINMPLNVWTSIITSDSALYGNLSSYKMVDVMALLARGYCAVYGTVSSSPSPTVNGCKTSLTGYTNSAFNDQTIVFLTGANVAGSCTLISSSNASGTLTFDEPLHQAPNVGDEFMILPMHVHLRGAIADKLLGRSIAGAADGGRTVTDALRVLRNKTSISGTTLTVTQENDATTAWTATLSTNPTADPVTGIDPA
jgi:hypothetical protein